VIRVRVDTQLRRKLEKLAAKEGRSLSNLIRHTLTQLVRKDTR